MRIGSRCMSFVNGPEGPVIEGVFGWVQSNGRLSWSPTIHPTPPTYVAETRVGSEGLIWDGKP